ncbi:HD domain-containing protein [Carboxylicivirga linearis]|uniref:HD domain-containing protein n=1 Tax=Carboxylicivirga linearis TaxID=1628157 RepID=A0ABS5JSB6_9BACT|nr:HD domain-containing protein [Carboxylicivirga linearis]MBS2097759.1 HD domain-containing protein [Carboxylicivirga linearis]
MSTGNKKKIINDPVYGFIKVPFDIIYDLMEHPFFQRLRRIRQLGLTHFVYPGAMHTRFQHAMGAMHLMSSAVAILQSKGHEITKEESIAVHAAILLHDIGHGPFSHVLENTLLEVDHEDISKLMMQELNREFNGQLDMTLSIFNNTYHKKFLHQLVSSQLDMDRLDYLKRDSFFTGVSEGVIGSDRIIKMLNIHNDSLVIESKGIYSIEKFLVARRLMYWQVYLHKTALAAEQMLINILKRARQLVSEGEELFAPPHLLFFMKQKPTIDDFHNQPEIFKNFALLDDDDIMSSIKSWTLHPDAILSNLANDFINRKLFRVSFSNSAFKNSHINEIKKQIAEQMKLDDMADVNYFIITDHISNNAYSKSDDQINILFSDGSIKDIAAASDMLNLSVLGKTVKKHYLCHPKSVHS